MISYTVGGDTKRTEKFLDSIIKGDLYSNLEGHAQRGVDALMKATPRDSGETALQWSYEIVRKSGYTVIYWKNGNIVNGFNVAIGLQYGHATGSGGWIEGQDYINGALKPIFDEIANDVWKEVQKA